MENKSQINENISSNDTVNKDEIDESSTKENDIPEKPINLWKDDSEDANIMASNPDPETTEIQPEQSMGGGLVISMTGKKYHKPDCRTVKQVKQSVTAE